VIAERDVQSEYVKVKAGEVSGMRQTARCLGEGKERVNLEVLFLRRRTGAERSDRYQRNDRH
jgi:hypothetical protein